MFGLKIISESEYKSLNEIVTQKKKLDSNYSDALRKIDLLENSLKNVKEEFDISESEWKKLLNTANSKIDELTTSDLDQFLAEKFKTGTNKTYKVKRSIKGRHYSILLNNMIQPNEAEVKNFKDSIITSVQDSWSIFNRCGNALAQRITWTDDGNLDKSGDFYLYPEELLALNEGDCEDHAFCLASMDPNIGVVYGFYTDGKNKFGHAWNCCLVKGSGTTPDSLWYGDAVGDQLSTFPESQVATSQYEPCFIVTRFGTYIIKDNIDFGFSPETRNKAYP